LLPTIAGGAAKREQIERAKMLVDRVGLADRLEHRPAELSGGERQRVAVARALIHKPALLLADEPTGNLDSRSREDVLALFHSLNEQGITIVMVTHDLEVAEHAKRVLVIRDGLLADDRLNPARPVPAVLVSVGAAATPLEMEEVLA
jgi:ABC-type lipoprotein export system ATPase subunit